MRRQAQEYEARGGKCQQRFSFAVHPSNTIENETLSTHIHGPIIGEEVRIDTLATNRSSAC